MKTALDQGDGLKINLRAILHRKSHALLEGAAHQLAEDLYSGLSCLALPANEAMLANDWYATE